MVAAELAGVYLMLGILLTSLSMFSMAWNMTSSQKVLIGDNLLENTEENTKKDTELEVNSYWYFHGMICFSKHAMILARNRLVKV